MYFGQSAASLIFAGVALYGGLNGSQFVRGGWSRLVLILLVVTTLSSFFAHIQYFESFQRVSGSIIDPNNFSAVMYVSSFLLLTIQRPNALKNPIQFLLLFAMFATFSRSGIAAWMLGILGYGVVALRLAPERKRQWFTYLLIALFAYTAVKITPLLFDHESVSRHFADMHNLNARWPMWLSTWELIKQAPLLGHGFGSFALLYPAVRTEFGSAGLVAHNDYLQIWMEGGLFLFALFVAWVLFHGWLLFRILFLEHGAGRNRKVELAGLLIINLALFSHATFNFVFYNLYLNMVAWLISLPKRITYGRAAGVLTSVVLVLFTGKLILVESSNAIYGRYENKPALMKDLAQNDDVLEWFLRIDPDNKQASEVYIRKLLSALPALPEEQKGKAFQIAWAQVSRIQEKYANLPRFYVMAGDLLAEGVRQNIPDVPDLAMGHWSYALQVNPGYIPAHLRIAGYVEEQQGVQMAMDYLLGKQLIWLNITPWPKAEIYWQEVKRLAEVVDPDKAEKIEQLIQASRAKVNALSPLRRYYRG